MIKDRIENAGMYGLAHPLFEKAFAFLREADLAHMETGTYRLEGDDLYVMLQDNRLAGWSEYRWETHREHIDIQFVVKGRVVIGQMAAAAMTPDGGFIPERDVQFYEEAEGGRTYLVPGEFAVFYPQDAHKPNLLPPDGEDGERVLVAITKVRVAALGNA